MVEMLPESRFGVSEVQNNGKPRENNDKTLKVWADDSDPFLFEVLKVMFFIPATRGHVDDHPTGLKTESRHSNIKDTIWMAPIGGIWP